MSIIYTAINLNINKDKRFGLFFLSDLKHIGLVRSSLAFEIPRVLPDHVTIEYLYPFLSKLRRKKSRKTLEAVVTNKEIFLCYSSGGFGILV